MEMDQTTLAAEIETARCLLATDRPRAVASLRMLEEESARATLGLASSRHPERAWMFDPRLVADVRRVVEDGLSPGRAAEAEARLAAAEEWQWEIGTWSTGAGEGLASMFEVRALQLARAWLLAARATEATDLREQARHLARGVAADPNDIAASLRGHVDALLAFARDR